MADAPQTDLKLDSKAKQAEEPVVDGLSAEQSVFQAAPIGQHAPRKFTTPQILQLQRTIGNHATNQLMRQPQRPTIQHHTLNQPIQRASATVKGKVFGKTDIIDPLKRVVAKVAKNVVLEVDTERNIMGVQCYRVIDADEDMFTGVTSAFNPDDIYIAVADVTVAPPRQDLDDIAPIDEEEASDPASLEIELFEGHKFVLTPDSAKAEGEVEKTLEADLPSVDLSIDIPIPAAPGVYVSAGLAITPSLGLAAKLAYALEKNPTETKFNIDAELGGSTGLEITAKGLVGVGLANVAGVSAGLFAEAKASAELKGKLVGEVVQKTGKVWKSSSLKLSLEAEASIVGAVGAMIQAKLGPLSASKKYKLKEKEFAKFEWKREGLNIEKEGVSMASIIPKLSDFKMAVTKDSPSPLDDVTNERAPLLGRGKHSDDY
jgi:hypothetical protein